MGDATRIVVAQMARVYLAPVGTTAPTDATTVMSGSWKEVGLFTPDSLKWSTNPSFEEVRSHQSNFATRRFQTADEAKIEVDLQEWSGDNFYAVYGGGTLTKTGAVYKFTPPAIGARIDVAVVVEIIDGGKKYRRIIPRATQTEGVEQSFQRASESILPLRLSVLGSDVGDAWYDLSNDPLFDPGASTLSLPYFTSASPTTSVLAGGVSITITGGNLSGVTGATLGGTACTAVTVLSPTTVTLTTPVQTAGSKPLVLTGTGSGLPLSCGNLTVS